MEKKLQLFSGECFVGNCGESTNLFDDFCDWEEHEDGTYTPIPNLYVGDQVMVCTRSYDKKSIDCMFENCAVVNCDGRHFIMGLSTIDFSTENEGRNEWLIKKVKSYADCVENEILPQCARITYKKTKE